MFPAHIRPRESRGVETRRRLVLRQSPTGGLEAQVALGRESDPKRGAADHEPLAANGPDLLLTPNEERLEIGPDLVVELGCPGLSPPRRH